MLGAWRTPLGVAGFRDINRGEFADALAASRRASPSLAGAQDSQRSADHRQWARRALQPGRGGALAWGDGAPPQRLRPRPPADRGVSALNPSVAPREGVITTHFEVGW